MSTELFDIKDEIKNYFETIVDDYIEHGEHELEIPIDGAKTNKELIKKISYSGATMIIFNKLNNLKEKLKYNPSNKEAIINCINIINTEIKKSNDDFSKYWKDNIPAVVPKPKTK